MRLPQILVTLLLAAIALKAQEPARRPNLLFVLTDDQRFDQMGCAGHPVLETPNMDRMARDGVRFTNAFVTTAICAASRASILTGMREGHHQFTFGTPPMGEALARRSYPLLLRQAGYRTGFVGKFGVKYEQGTMAEAFDYKRTPSYPYVREGQKHLTERTTDLAIEFLQQQSDQPFCLSLSFNAPHAQDNHPEQYLPMPECQDLYADAEVPVPPYAEQGFEVLPPFLKQSLGRVRWGWRFDTREKQIQRTKDYWRLLTGIDRSLGRIFQALEQTGQLDNTVIVLLGDNGYFLGERGLAGKWLIYEESIRVPLLVLDPRAPKSRCGVTVDQMALNVDIAPTLLELAGVTEPTDADADAYDGRSLVPLLRGETPDDWRHDFLHEHLMDHPKIPKNVGVRGERYVYARYITQDPVFEQLFDLQNDPFELHDLARDPAHAALLAKLRARCDELLAN